MSRKQGIHIDMEYRKLNLFLKDIQSLSILHITDEYVKDTEV